eukprot:11823-Heterococcus_DN1.PRE.2
MPKSSGFSSVMQATTFESSLTLHSCTAVAVQDNYVTDAQQRKSITCSSSIALHRSATRASAAAAAAAASNQQRTVTSSSVPALAVALSHFFWNVLITLIAAFVVPLQTLTLVKPPFCCEQALQHAFWCCNALTAVSMAIDTVC